MITEITGDLTKNLQTLGGKAHNLNILKGMGLPIPPALVIEASLSNRSNKQKLILELNDPLLNHDVIKSGELFAVRSSGVGEDSLGNSWAGIFESELFVPKERITSAILQVWNSTSSDRAHMYAVSKGVEVLQMAVIVQHMVDADYAGVAFSVCPLEKDNRIALVEIVKGVGESLVSGSKTPATIRYNKLTGTLRVHQSGIDELDDNTIRDIIKQLMPFVMKIEDAYGLAVDVEWAIHAQNLYILQARPITVS